MQVRLSSKGRTIVSETIRLVEENNFCGSAEVRGLSPKTTYSYRVYLDSKVQGSDVRQEVTTFGRAREPGIIRIGFGHSLKRGGAQDTWKAVSAKKPDLFILMGDNIYSNSTEPAKQRRMYLEFRADRYFRAFGASTPIYAVWDDHDYGDDNSDRSQPGKERSLKTFNEIWPNPKSQAVRNPGIWTRFTVGGAEFFLMDVRYHRSANSDPDGPDKTMLGKEQLTWLKNSLASSKASFKFPVSGSSWNCGGPEAWNHTFKYEYDALVRHIAAKKISGIILLGGDQHTCKIAVRPKESWGGYDLHEWMAGQLWNTKSERDRGYGRAFGLITLDTTKKPATARLEFFDRLGEPHKGRRILYTTLGALRGLLDSPVGVTGVTKENRSYIDRLRPTTSGPLWEIMPVTTGETLTEDDLDWK
jgi:alkaline phosphatase D